MAYKAAEEERARRFFGIQKAKFVAGLPELLARLSVLNLKIQGLAQQKYAVCNVFVTLETEEQQQQLLYELYDTETLFHKILHKIYKMTGCKGHEHPVTEGRPKFRGDDKRDIYCKEPEEPDAIHWTDLGEHVSTELKQRAVTAVITAGLLFCVLLIEAVIFDAWTEDLILDLKFYMLHIGPSYVISIFNTVFPMVAKSLVAMENHKSEDSRQYSLYYKITL